MLFNHRWSTKSESFYSGKKDIKYVAAGFFVGGAVKKDGTLIIWGEDAEKLYKNDNLDKLILHESKDWYFLFWQNISYGGYRGDSYLWYAAGCIWI